MLFKVCAKQNLNKTSINFFLFLFLHNHINVTLDCGSFSCVCLGKQKVSFGLDVLWVWTILNTQDL